MAHFAQLDENNVVLQVIVVHNNELMDGGVESEAKGIEFCQSLFSGTNWKQTSYNGKMRKNYAGIGFTYDAMRDAFIAPKPFPSWLLNEASCTWEAPIPMPTDAGTGNPPKRYRWDEATISWVEFV